MATTRRSAAGAGNRLWKKRCATARTCWKVRCSATKTQKLWRESSATETKEEFQGIERRRINDNVKPNHRKAAGQIATHRHSPIPPRRHHSGSREDQGRRKGKGAGLRRGGNQARQRTAGQLHRAQNQLWPGCGAHFPRPL